MLVVDCAAVVDALTAVEGTERLRRFLARDEIGAPALLDFEVVAALRGLVLRGRIGTGRAADALTDYDDLPLHRWPAGDGLRRRAFQLRDNITAYDAAYVALAEALDCPLITRDARLARACGGLVRVELL